MKSSQFEKWAKIRQKGKKRFVWVHGVLLLGISTATLFAIITEFAHPSGEFIVRFLIALCFFPISGYFWGHYMWKEGEKRYLNDSRHSNDL